MRLFPPQGHWSEGSYLSFTESLDQLVELVDGRVEVLEGFEVDVADASHAG
ncbi:MAG: hypothetical protein JJ992_19600 [Planctomycetes bacterium]|nr:hypothetical protein [Planctomycetota bacterium]